MLCLIRLGILNLLPILGREQQTFGGRLQHRHDARQRRKRVFTKLFSEETVSVLEPDLVDAQVLL